MRRIDFIVLHTTATPLTTTVESIKSHWRNVLGWKTVGYHFIIEANGKVHELQPLDKPTNGVKGYNANSIHIATIGGHKVDDRTPKQKTELYFLIKVLQQKFPNAKLLGHRDFPNVAKSCPRYNAEEWFTNYIPYEN
jgi:N-acetylmuramoyl-L-alanine amidase